MHEKLGLTRYPAFAAVILSLAACGGDKDQVTVDAPQVADLIVVNGDVRTVDPQAPSVTAFAVRDGKFVAIGDDATIEAQACPAAPRRSLPRAGVRRANGRGGCA